jgi:hypothetical protein
MTPAEQKSSIYHTWDFVGRTLQFLYMVDYSTGMREKKGKEREIFMDAVGRTKMSKEMIVTGGGRMVQTNVDVRVEFDDALKEMARDLNF